MFLKLVNTVFIVGVLFTFTTHAEEGQLQKAAPYPPAGYRPNKAFDLPTEGGGSFDEGRDGRALDEEITTTSNPLYEENSETTTTVLDYETTTTLDQATTQYPDLQGNKAERLQISPRLLANGGLTGSYAYSVQYQRW